MRRQVRMPVVVARRRADVIIGPIGIGDGRFAFVRGYGKDGSRCGTSGRDANTIPTNLRNARCRCFRRINDGTLNDAISKLKRLANDRNMMS